MGIFYTAQQQVLPAVQAAIHNALMANPPADAADAAHQAGAQTAALAHAVAPQFNAWRFVAAAVISVALLATAIATAKDYPDISKSLMTSFQSFSGIVLGLLGGEAQKSIT